MATLSEEEVRQALRQLPGWRSEGPGDREGLPIRRRLHGVRRLCQPARRGGRGRRPPSRPHDLLEHGHGELVHAQPGRRDRERPEDGGRGGSPGSPSRRPWTSTRPSAGRSFFRLDPERAHALALASLAASAPVLSGLAGPPDGGGRLAQDLLGTRFPNPVGLAAGFDKHAQAVPAWPALGFGFAEIGTITALPQEATRAPPAPPARRPRADQQPGSTTPAPTPPPPGSRPRAAGAASAAPLGINVQVEVTSPPTRRPTTPAPSSGSGAMPTTSR